eukprot:gene11736-biopygen6387
MQRRMRCSWKTPCRVEEMWHCWRRQREKDNGWMVGWGYVNTHRVPQAWRRRHREMQVKKPVPEAPDSATGARPRTPQPPARPPGGSGGAGVGAVAAPQAPPSGSCLIGWPVLMRGSPFVGPSVTRGQRVAGWWVDGGLASPARKDPTPHHPTTPYGDSCL